MQLRNGFIVALFALMPILTLTGCGSGAVKEEASAEYQAGDGHDHGGAGDHEHAHLTADDMEMPKDFDDAIVRIKACQSTLATALEESDLHEAHRPVDELTILFEEVMPLAKQSGIDRQHWKEMNLLVKEMTEQLNTVHEAIEHHQEGTVTPPPADQAIARLEEIAKEPRTVAE